MLRIEDYVASQDGSCPKPSDCANISAFPMLLGCFNVTVSDTVSQKFEKFNRKERFLFAKFAE